MGQPVNALHFLCQVHCGPVCSMAPHRQQGACACVTLRNITPMHPHDVTEAYGDLFIW